MAGVVTRSVCYRLHPAARLATPSGELLALFREMVRSDFDGFLARPVACCDTFTVQVLSQIGSPRGPCFTIEAA